MSLKTRNLILVAMFAAITSICAQLSIPLSPVPFTLQVLAVCLSGAILGRKLGALSQTVYLLLGVIGLPVFAQFQGGLNILVSHTGGYLLAFPFAAYMIGFITERKQGYLSCFISMLFALMIIYMMGIAQLKLVASLSWRMAFTYGAAPYLFFDLIKIIISTFLSVTVKNILIKNQLLPYNFL